jgi:hypothetical protein
MKKQTKPPKFTNKKKAIQVCAALAKSLEGVRASIEIMPTSMSWKEADDMAAALLEIQQGVLDLHVKLLAAAS